MKMFFFSGFVLVATGNIVAQSRELKYSLIDLGTLGGIYSEATDVNEVGQVVGYAHLANSQSHAFLWHDGTMIDLGTLGGNFSFAYAINEAGQVVGCSDLTSGQGTHACLWENGVITDLAPETSTISSAKSINARGKVVGYSYKWADLTSREATIWRQSSENSYVSYNLNTLVVNPPTGVHLQVAEDINDAGLIVGYGIMTPEQVHAYLLKPRKVLRPISLENSRAHPTQAQPR